MKTFPIMKTKPVIFSAVALTLVLCSCATTKLENTWKSPDYHGEQFKKIGVIMVDPRPMIRQTLEGQTATQLEARGQPALPVNGMMTIEEIKASKERAAESLRQSGVDAVLVQRVVDRDTALAKQGKAANPPTPTFSSGTMGWFDYYFVSIPAPSLAANDLTSDFYVESSLYDLKSEKRLWSCTTMTKVSEEGDRLKLVKPFAVTIADAMAKDGVIR